MHVGLPACNLACWKRGGETMLLYCFPMRHKASPRNRTCLALWGPIQGRNHIVEWLEIQIDV